MDTSPGKRQLQTNRNNSHSNKRQRSRNFTKYEKEVFYSLFREYEGIINNKAYSPESIRDAWSRLLVDYNSQQDVFPRTRRQLQVLWRDEKFRAKKKGRQDQQTTETERENEEGNDNTDEREADTNEERRTASFLSPLLAVIKQEQELQDALTAETTAAAVAEATTTHYSTSPSPDLYVNSNTEEGPSSPLPVETQLESCSSTSPLTRLQEEDDEEEVDEDECDRFSTFPSHHSRSSSHQYHRPRLPSHDRHPSPPSRHWFPMHSNNGVASVTFHTEEQEREYHRVRMTQLREEGAARLRLLEAELALYHQERHSRQQEHQLRMQILMEKLRKVRDGHT